LKEKKQHVLQTASITEALAQSLQLSTIMERVTKLHTPIEMKIEETKAKAGVGETKKISLQLFKEGKNIDEIATARGMVKGTIEGHLAEFIITGEIEITDLVHKTKLDAILKFLRENPDATSSIIREKLGSSFSFGEIKAVMAFSKMES